MEIAYETLADRLTGDAAELYREMVAAHLESGRGDRRFLLAEHMGGNSLIFVGPDHSQRDWENVDPGALQDLASYGLLRVEYGGRGTPNYRVTGEGLAFYRWWMRQLGAPLEQARAETQRIVTGDAFAARHPGASHHLTEAFALLWQDRLDDQTVSELGDHLRKALMDVVSDVDGADGGKVEQPVLSLKTWIQSRPFGDREKAVVDAVLELARASLRLDHRLNHIRDEAELGEPSASMSELRRAAFATALACEEIDRISEGP